MLLAIVNTWTIYPQTTSFANIFTILGITSSTQKLLQCDEKKSPHTNPSDDKKNASQDTIPFSIDDLVLQFTELLDARFD